MYICQNQTFNIFQLLYTYYLYTVVLFFYIYPFILIFHLFNSYFKISINNKILDKLLFYFLPIFLLFLKHISYMVRSFKFILKVGLEESIVNALYGLRISCLNLTFFHEWCVHNRLFNANFENKFK
jgi:hypothetical protein